MKKLLTLPHIFVNFKTSVVISLTKTTMLCFDEFHSLLTYPFDWIMLEGNFLASQNWDGFALTGCQN